MSECLSWEKKLRAIQALGGVALHMRKPGDWYINQSSVELGDGSILDGGCVRNAATPEEAVNKHWEWLTNPPNGYHVVVGAHTGARHDLQWNGFMWEDWNGQ